MSKMTRDEAKIRIKELQDEINHYNSLIEKYRTEDDDDYQLEQEKHEKNPDHIPFCRPPFAVPTYAEEKRKNRTKIKKLRKQFGV